MKRNIYIKNTPLKEAIINFNQALDEIGYFCLQKNGSR